jgi:hypothetical protein
VRDGRVEQASEHRHPEHLLHVLSPSVERREAPACARWYETVPP